MHRRKTPELRTDDADMISDKPTNGTTSPSRTKSTSLISSTSGQRVIVIVVGLVSLFFITKIFLPSDHSFSIGGGHQVQRTEQLIARNYLNTSTTPAPFDFCPIYGPGDPMATKYGGHNLARGRIHTGSGARVQRVMHKALSGLPVTISVLGGSVSACHGAGDNPISPKCYPARFFEWWNSVFPHPASELTNGAMRKTNSAYFSFCNMHHLPDQTDLVILEFASDDPNEPAWLDHFDLLIRSILQRPDQPAIVILGHFSPQMHATYGYSDPLHTHTIVAQFYDIPILATKPVIFNEFINNPTGMKNMYWVDPVLANPAGHELLADVLISYFEEMTCKGWDASLGRGFEVPVIKTDAMGSSGAAGLFGGVGGRKGGENGPGAPGAAVPNAAAGAVGKADTGSGGYAALRIPPLRTSDRSPISEHFREPRPFCVSANDLINPLPPSLFYGSGWHSNTPVGGRSASPDQAGAQGYYWYSMLPTSKLRVPVKLHAGDVAIYYMVEPRSSSREDGAGIMCWVDDNVAGGVEISGVADVGSSTPKMTIIDRGVDAGSHFVECMLLGEEGEASPMFKLLGIFVT
ncbi:cap64-like protein [Tulasnella sp. JGI-2019a]|nr:cap64-like protein [Tulasnella sp. JGI-2019a]